MHPLEVQVNDLKDQLAARNKIIDQMREHVGKMKEELDELKDMLHPSRQKYAQVLRDRCEEIHANLLKRH